MNPQRRPSLFALPLLLLALSVAAQAQQPELVVQTGHSSPVNVVSFSPDGRLLASGSGVDGFVSVDEANVVKLWDAATGAELRTLGHDAPVQWVAFSPDGRRVAARYGQLKPRVWEVSTGAEVAGTSTEGYVSLAASPVGKLSAEIEGKNIRLLEAGSRRVVHTLASRTSDFQKVLFSPDSAVLATGGERFSIRLWDLRSGVLRTLAGHTDYPIAAAFSPDSRLFVSGGRDLSVRVWDVASGREVKQLKGHTDGYVRAIHFGPDGRTFITADKSGFKLWDVESWRELAAAPGDFDSDFHSVAYSPRGDLLAARAEGGTRLWAAATGKEVATLAGAGFSVYFSPDGKFLQAESSRQIELWDVAAATRVAVIKPSGDGDDDDLKERFVRSVFSPDSRTLAVAELDTGGGVTTDKWVWWLRLYEAATGKPLRTIEVKIGEAGVWKKFDAYSRVVFSADGRQVMALGSENLNVWDVATGRQVRAATIPRGRYNHHHFDAATFREMWAFAPHYYSVYDYSQYSPDGAFYVAFGLNGELRLVGTRGGREVVSMIGVDEEDWLAATPEGFFDGSPAAWQRILWRFDNDTFKTAPVESFFSEFYHPGLLGDVLAGRTPSPPAGKELARVDRRQPKVTLTQGAVVRRGATRPAKASDGRTVRLAVLVEENADRPSREGHPATSGARDVRLFRNGSLVRVWRGDVLKGRRRATLEADVPIVAGENRFTAYAFNRDNVKSADATLSVTGAESLRRKGTAYVVAVGVNAYANAAFDLRYAVADADAFAAEFRNQQNLLGLFERVEVVSLRDREATKRNILNVLAGVARRAQPEDAVAFYFAGHGKAHRGRFYLIPHDLGYAGGRARVDDARAAAAILAHGVSDRELESAFEGLDAGQLLMVIDACESGQALGAEGERRGPMNSKGLAQLAYEKGMYILTAAQSFQAAQEVSKLGHGLLTYALVEEGLRRGAGDAEPKDGEVRLREWLDYAARRVPEMRVEEVTRAMSRGVSLSFDDGARALTVSARSGQQPRVFYRREAEASPLLVARPPSGRE